MASLPPRTAADAGWHESRYNLRADIPATGRVAIANLYKGSCAEYGPFELYALSHLDELPEGHPMVARLARRGLVADFDELAALETKARMTCAFPAFVRLTVAPTMACNFDCPYCFEDHPSGAMTEAVQDEVVGLAERMLDASGARELSVSWFGGEPLLAPQVIERLSARLIALADVRGVSYRAGIMTNGYLLTQDSVALLAAARVGVAQVTLDGIGAVHDATRHLVGGGATFERIVSNLRGPIPFHVSVRHNVHAGNLNQIDALRTFVAELAKQSGNDLTYYAAPVKGSPVADRRGNQVGLLGGDDGTTVAARHDAIAFESGRGHRCSAQSLWMLGVDAAGKLYRCVEAMDDPAASFGTARGWDPTDPIGTATSPDNLTAYLNTALPADEECRACRLLPVCAGGCPRERLRGARQCVGWRDQPETYVLALLERLGK